MRTCESYSLPSSNECMTNDASLPRTYYEYPPDCMQSPPSLQSVRRRTALLRRSISISYSFLARWRTGLQLYGSVDEEPHIKTLYTIETRVRSSVDMYVDATALYRYSSLCTSSFVRCRCALRRHPTATGNTFSPRLHLAKVLAASPLESIADQDASPYDITMFIAPLAEKSTTSGSSSRSNRAINGSATA